MIIRFRCLYIYKTNTQKQHLFPKRLKLINQASFHKSSRDTRLAGFKNDEQRPKNFLDTSYKRKPLLLDSDEYCNLIFIAEASYAFLHLLVICFMLFEHGVFTSEL
jgi:hypothetical protein